MNKVTHVGRNSDLIMKDAFSLPKSNPQELMPENSQDDRVSRMAFEEILLLLGTGIRNAVIEDLEAKGAMYTGQNHLEMRPVLETLARFFGYNPALRMLDRIKSRAIALKSEIDSP